MTKITAVDFINDYENVVNYIAANTSDKTLVATKVNLIPIAHYMTKREKAKLVKHIIEIMDSAAA